MNWAKLPNVVMKLAAIPQPSEYPHRDITATIKQLCDVYGADRMIYGGGFGPTATAESYRAAAQRVRGYLSHWSEDNQAKVLGRNAMKLFGFGS
jgi:predicted TIM-barrel fold metal-dependent hydrolase